jgi:endonuclease YncB( thermonuclease family)
MKRLSNPAVRIFLLAVALSLALESARAAEWILEGHVVGVSDGHTMTVLDDAKTQHKVRFAGIDAPESGQAFGERSEQNLSALVFQKRVEARCHKRDRYGRQVCAVFVGLRDVGLEQIRAGMAWWYREYAHEQRTHEQLLYRDAEEGAKARRVGLWKDAKPVPPWEWRAGRW